MPTSDIAFEYSNEEWDRQMKRKCKCGHELYLHAFTTHRHPMFPDQTVLWTSQCCRCPVDVKNNTFACERFEPL